MSPRWNAPRSQWLFNLTHSALLKGKGQRGTKWRFFFFTCRMEVLIYRWGDWHVLAEDNRVFSLATSACRRSHVSRQEHVYGTGLLCSCCGSEIDRSTQAHCSQHGTLDYKQIHWILFFTYCNFRPEGQIRSLLACMVPWRTFNILWTFPAQKVLLKLKLFFMLLKYSLH